MTKNLGVRDQYDIQSRLDQNITWGIQLLMPGNISEKASWTGQVWKIQVEGISSFSNLNRKNSLSRIFVSTMTNQW